MVKWNYQCSEATSVRFETRTSVSSVLRSTRLGKSDLNGEVKSVLHGVLFTVEYSLGLSKGDYGGEVTLLVR